MVRGGRHLGDRAYFPTHVDGALPDGETSLETQVLKAFLAQHYIDKFIPGNLIINTEFDDPALMLALMEQCGHRITLTFQPQGQRRQWLEMAHKGGEIALARLLSEQGSQQARTRALVEALGTEVDDIDTLRIECFDISHTLASSTIITPCKMASTDVTTSTTSPQATTTLPCARSYRGAMKK